MSWFFGPPKGPLIREAVEKGDSTSVAELLRKAKPKDINETGKDGQTALMLACKNGHAGVVKLLMAAGADRNVLGKNGWTALMMASERGHAEVVKLLTAAGARIHALNKDGWTALMVASEKGHTEVVKLLMAAGANKNVQGMCGDTALMRACEKGHAEVVKLLLDAGADMKAQNFHGDMALKLACQKGHVEVVKLLMAAGVDNNAQGDSFNADTALMRACGSGHVEVAKLLLNAGAKKHVQRRDGWTALILASVSGHAEVVKLLMDAGADIHVQEDFGSTALMKACTTGQAEVVKLLMDAGGDIHAQNHHGYTALMWATEKGHTEVVKLLLDAGANKNVKNNKGETALGLANNLDIVNLLRSTGNSDASAAAVATATPAANAEETVQFSINANSTASSDDKLSAQKTVTADTPATGGVAQVPAEAQSAAKTSNNSLSAVSSPVRLAAPTPSSIPPATITAEVADGAVGSVGAGLPYMSLKRECESLLSLAAQEAQRRDIATRLAEAKAAREVARIAGIRHEETALTKAFGSPNLSEVERGDLPRRLHELEDRLLDFSLECDVESVDDITRLQEALQQALRSLVTLSTNKPGDSGASPILPATSDGAAAYFSGSIRIADVEPAFSAHSAVSMVAPSARLMLRGRFETRDEFGNAHQYQCVIKCATHADGAPPHPHSIAAMRREHEMYQEIHRLSATNPTGCVRLFSAHPQHHYLVLEDHGTDLRDVLNPSLRSPQLVLEAVVSAVHSLHSLGIIHGDIKPQNLLYKLFSSGHYVVKLCDLDAAHKVGDTCRATSLGTQHYHSPELRAAAQQANTVQAAQEFDMFALGLVLWQVLARSPHAALDCAQEDALYTSQEKLDAHLNYPAFYKEQMRMVTCINPAQRMNITDLYRAVKSFSASSAQQGWMHERQDHHHLKQVVGTQLGTISEKLDKIDIKLDLVLQELRTRFEALGTSAVEIAESLRTEIVLGGQQAQVLPDMILATDDALKRISEAQRDSESQRNPAVASAQMQECMSSMQISIDAAVSRALARQNAVGDGGEFRALAAQLQGRVAELSAELQAHFQDQRQSSASTAQLVAALAHTSECLRMGVAEVLGSLKTVQRELIQLREIQQALGKQVTVVLASNAELSAMVRTLITSTSDLPTLAIVLPEVSTSWKSRFTPMRLVRDQYRLYFLCGHTHQIAPCGPKGKGYKVTMTKQWVLDAAPVLRVGLVLLKVALLASGLPLPVPDLCSALVGSAMDSKYLDAALQLVAHPPSAALNNAELVLETTLDAIDEHDYSDYKAPGAEMRLQEGSRKAYETIKAVLGRDGVNIPLTCGLRQVTHGGQTAWVLDNEETVKAWKEAVDGATP